MIPSEMIAHSAILICISSETITRQMAVTTNFNEGWESQRSRNSIDNLITQNLVISEEILKLIVIGDKGSGKSLLIDKVSSNNTLKDMPYEPTLA